MKRQTPNKKKGRVFVALSGGVDSSVAAALLQREGFDVTAVHMKCWSAELTASCMASDDERSARLAAAHLGVPFYVWNFIDEYRERVVNYLIEGYRQGVTPNPDIMCNKEIKFGLFFEKAMKLGADYVATGHYAKIRRCSCSKTGGSPAPAAGDRLPSRLAAPSTSSGDQARFASESSSHKRTCSPSILVGSDQEKDQSYFLSFISPGVLSKVLFPLGEYTKKEVRQMARELGLPNAERKDSQGICFVGKIPVSDFLRQYIEPKRGPIVDTAGTKIGEHEGAFFYTIGQRQGIGLAGGPWYVVSKDVRSNTLVVSRSEKDIERKEARVENVRWFLEGCVIPGITHLEVKLRYRQESVPVRLSPNGKEGSYDLAFSSPQRAVTPGQFAVFYKRGELLGGGVIRGIF